MQQPSKQDSIQTPNLLSEDPIQCAICHKPSNQLLGLVCSHDVCLQCAAHSYFADKTSHKQHRNKSESTSIFWCQLCFQATIIEKSSIDLMNEFIRSVRKHKQSTEKQAIHPHQSIQKQQKNKAKRTNSKNRQLMYSKDSRSRSSSKFSKQIANSLRRHHQLGSSKSRKHLSPDQKMYMKQDQVFDDYLQLVTSHNIRSGQILADSGKTKDYRHKNNKRLSASPYQSVKNQYSKKRFLCNHHQDEELTYFCNYCKKTLCPECAINGPHKSHQVISLKRYPSKFQQAFEEIIEQTNQHRHRLEKYLKQVEEWLQKFVSVLTYNQQTIKNKFESLHHLLNQKQEQLLRQLNSKCDEDIKRVKKQSRNIQNLTKHAKKSERTILDIFRMDPKNWDIIELERQKEVLEALNIGRFKATSSISMPPQKAISLSLITQAIDLIEQLVNKFKLQIQDSIK